MLRNRRTNQYHGRDGKPLRASPTLYSVPTYHQLLPGIIDSAPESLREVVKELCEAQMNASVMDAVKIERAKKLVELFKQSEPYILEIAKDPDMLKNLADACAADQQETEKHKQKHGDDKQPGFMKHLLQTLAMGAVSNYSPLAGMLLAGFAPVAAAAASNIQVHGGIPPGGQNLCGSLNIYCIQGYLTLPEDQQGYLAQFSRNMIVSSGGDNGGVSLALLDCLDTNKIGNTVAELFVNGTRGSRNCVANSIQVSGGTASVQATNLDLENCIPFQDKINPVFNECINYHQSVGMWIGIGIAAAVVAAAAITGAVCLARHMDCCNRNDR